MEKLAYKQKSGSPVSEEIVNTSNEVYRVGNDEGRVSYACACIVTLIVYRELRGSLLSKGVRKRDFTQEINTLYIQGYCKYRNMGKLDFSRR